MKKRSIIYFRTKKDKKFWVGMVLDFRGYDNGINLGAAIIDDGCAAKPFTFSIDENTELTEKNFDSWIASIPAFAKAIQVVKEDEFRCAVCHNVFVRGLTEEEANEELKKEFGANVKTEDCDVVCHTCYEKIMQSIKN